MKKIFKLCIYIIFFIVVTLILLPKNSIYNLVEEKLSKQNVVISEEKREEKLLSLDVTDAKVYYQGIEGLNINSINFLTFLVYSEIEVKNIKLLENLSFFFPSYIKNIVLKHSLLDYKNINIYGHGDFGVLNGNIDLMTRTLLLKIKPSKNMKDQYLKVLRQMKLDKGEYIYEYRF
ncbi:MAG: hypothetical protein CL624_13115 [Arcobacter sp.]|nr:hypothetical protein [Arcobacter sp.]|tara:strand:- start:6982 stop:7509 length:528 start_codon:yes stop_codon:yes gene_type:complete